MSSLHSPQQPVLPVVVGDVVTVSVPGVGGGRGGGQGGPLCPLLPRGLVIDGEQEVSLGAQAALAVQLSQQETPARPGPGALLHDAPGAVQGLHHVVYLPVGLAQLVTLLLHEGVELSNRLLQFHSY